MKFYSPNIRDILRSTLRKLEANPEVDPNDPHYQILKSSILRSLAELDMRELDAA